MAISIFNLHNSERRFPVPLLALETYAIGTSTCATDADFMGLFNHVMQDICGVDDPSPEDLDYFITRLKAIEDEAAQNIVKSKVTKNIGRSFGTSYNTYLGGLTLDSTLMRMTGYNFEAASYIYGKLDRDDALRLVGEYIAGIMEDGVLMLDATLYASGNSYNESKPGTTHDLSTDEGKAALRRMGF